ncbi:complex I subunit 4 family protein [Falsibacillus albus]|uniref:NADH-quinone oxidoreductase subunit M n=1 Tax=Falsibacillus albus TaxID=2478915 RepID=A0A3L7JN19_9BACI|nr:NADH-quinone oxidoreductase subunit M [Falsibacillus albus]RLQ89962.1 NADH-quinone oxidoreductase subunit M [Falsibacillus albus]
MNASYFLPLLVFAPIVMLLIMAIVPKTEKTFIQRFLIIGTLPSLAIAIYGYVKFLQGNSLESWAIHHRWLQFGDLSYLQEKMFQVDFEMGVDGLSILMVLLTAIIATMAAIASFKIQKEWKGYASLFLLLETGMLGVFTSGNMVLFFLFFELTLVATFFLIGKWGGIAREKAAYSYLIYNGLGSALLLFVIVLTFIKTGSVNFEKLQFLLAGNAAGFASPVSGVVKGWMLAGILVAFAFKLPAFPLHRWMVKVHVEAPPSIVMLHSGVLLKMGAYGMIRFGLELFPKEFHLAGLWIMIAGLVNLLYGALIAFVQSDLKKVLAYSSISHMGIVLLGLGAANEAGVQGAIFQSVSHGFISAFLFMLVGILVYRGTTTDIRKLGGLAKKMPMFSGFLLAAGLASLGLPGMSGFISEFMTFLGVFQKWPVIGAIGTLGIILTAVYVLKAVLNITFGEMEIVKKKWFDLKRAEWIPSVCLTFVILLIGLYPSIISKALQHTIESLMIGMGG